MADLFIVGQYDGVASTTAVLIGSQIMHMITVMIVGFAVGTTGNTTFNEEEMLIKNMSMSLF